MDKGEIRREYLRQGGDIRATARALGISRPTVYRAIRSLPPLTYQQGEAEDRSAMIAFVRASLARVGILTSPPQSPAPTEPPPASDSPDWERIPAQD